MIYRLSLSLLLYILLSPINYRDKQFFCAQCLNFKVSELALWENTRCPLRLVVILNNYFFVLLLDFTAESANCSLFLKNLEKTFLKFDLQNKNFVKHIENLSQHLSEKFIGDNLSITDIALRN